MRSIFVNKCDVIIRKLRMRQFENFLADAKFKLNLTRSLYKHASTIVFMALLNKQAQYLIVFLWCDVTAAGSVD